MDCAEITKAFGEKLGINFVPDADGAIAFEADGMIVNVSPLQGMDMVAIVGDLGEPPPERLENLYKIILQAQYLLQDTAGATISINPGNGRFTLFKALPCATLDVDSFSAEVEKFLNTLETWCGMIENYRDAADAAPAAETMDAPSLGANGFLAV